MNGNYVFCVVCDCWSPDGRWCCLTMFGTPVVVIVMQLLEDGERLRVIPRKHNFSPSVAKPTIDKLPGDWRMHQETGAKSFKDDNPNATPFSCIVVS